MNLLRVLRPPFCGISLSVVPIIMHIRRCYGSSSSLRETPINLPPSAIYTHASWIGKYVCLQEIGCSCIIRWLSVSKKHDVCRTLVFFSDKKKIKMVVYLGLSRSDGTPGQRSPPCILHQCEVFRFKYSAWNFLYMSLNKGWNFWSLHWINTEKEFISFFSLFLRKEGRWLISLFVFVYSAHSIARNIHSQRQT